MAIPWWGLAPTCLGLYTNGMDSNSNINITITSGTIIRSILFVLLVWLLWFLQEVVLVILTAVVIASSIEPLARWFVKYKIPRVLAVILIYVSFAGVVVGTFFAFIPPLLDDAAGLISSLPAYFDSITLWGPVADFSADFSLKNLLTEFRSSITGATGSLFQTLSVIFGGALNFVLIIVLSFYLSVQETGVRDFLKVVTPLKQEKYVIDLWRRTQEKIGLWMQGQLLLGIIIGILVYLGLTILGVKYAFFLAILAAVAELIPLFGPVVASLPAIVIGFADGGVTIGLFVIGLYIIIQQFENHLIYPLVVKKVVGVPPLLVILALIVGAKLAGFLGLILSVPIAAALMEFVHDIENDRRSQLKNPHQND
jgi:predicted PurR-regulated permease PerM